MYRVPNSQCEQIRELYDESKYTIACNPEKTDAEWLEVYLTQCADGDVPTSFALLHENELRVMPGCEKRIEQQDAAKALELGNYKYVNDVGRELQNVDLDK